jgi:hypothetical protein
VNCLLRFSLAPLLYGYSIFYTWLLFCDKTRIETIKTLMAAAYITGSSTTWDDGGISPMSFQNME